MLHHRQCAWADDELGGTRRRKRHGREWTERQKLFTFPDGVRIARTPVSEIQSLYATPVHFDAQVAASGGNPFATLGSKVFDLEVTIDLTQTTATTITFRAANLTFPFRSLPGSSSAQRFLPSITA